MSIKLIYTVFEDKLSKDDEWMLGEQNMLECQCGGKHFTVHHPDMYYTTVVQCTTCGRAYVAHTG